MNSWIDLHALWRIVVVGLICGAGLPAVFALGLKSLSLGEHDTVDGGGTATASAATTVGTARNPLGVVVAGICFAVVLAAIAWGIYLVVDGT